MRWLLYGLMAWLVACGGPSDVGVREGQVAPDFSALSLEGKAVRLSALRGQPVVLVFWASWCGPCRQEVPHVNALVASHGERAHVWGVNMGEDPRKAEAAHGAFGMRYPSLLDPTSDLARRFSVSSIPLVIVLDAQGRIRFRGNGLPRSAGALLDGLLGA